MSGVSLYVEFRYCKTLTREFVPYTERGVSVPSDAFAFRFVQAEINAGQPPIERKSGPITYIGTVEPRTDRDIAGTTPKVIRKGDRYLAYEGEPVVPETTQVVFWPESGLG